MAHREKLLTRDFLVLNVIMFLTYCNVALFFQFHEYLGTLPIDARWFGLLIGLFSLTVLAVRPMISPFLHPRNASRWIAVSCCWVIVALILYDYAHGLWSLALLRVFHGAGYVVMVTAVLSRLVAAIPQDRSGQAFGLFAVITLLPYAVFPPLVDVLVRMFGGFGRVMEASALLMLGTFPLLSLLEEQRAGTGTSSDGRVTGADTLRNLLDLRIALLLVVCLLLWTAFTPVFYFVKEYGQKVGAVNPGWFFTLSTLMEILVRVVAGSLFDRMNKAKLLCISLAWLTLGYLALAHAEGPIMFYSLGFVFGLGWGVAMPVVSGFIFDVSAPRFRAVNTNLAMWMFQAGFFLGPIIGGAILLDWGYSAMYLVCGGLMLVGVAASLLLIVRSRTAE
ncbi:MAG: MFS transporter [Desulfomonile tiedjei]|nr:MFS transporter [Desulfomonile tiedjei]